MLEVDDPGEQAAYLKFEAKHRREMLKDAMRGKGGVVNAAEVAFLRIATNLAAATVGDRDALKALSESVHASKGGSKANVIPFRRK